MATLDPTWASLFTIVGAALGSWLMWRQSKRSGDQTAEGTFRSQLWDANQAQGAEIKDLKAHIQALEGKQQVTDRNFRLLQGRYNRVETQLQYAVVWGQTVGRPEDDPRPVPSWLLGLPQNGHAYEQVEGEDDDG